MNRKKETLRKKNSCTKDLGIVLMSKQERLEDMACYATRALVEAEEILALPAKKGFLCCLANFSPFLMFSCNLNNFWWKPLPLKTDRRRKYLMTVRTQSRKR